MTPRANWDAHFARIIRVTVARMKERDERVDKGGKQI
jgi:hypothetical protein